MKRILPLWLVVLLFSLPVFGQTGTKKKRKPIFLKEMINLDQDSTQDDLVIDTEAFKPKIQVGAILHMYAAAEQRAYTQPGISEGATRYDKGFSLYRARVLVGGQVSPKGSFFMETEIPSIVGGQLTEGNKNVKVSPIILDAQYEHHFSEAFQVIAGMQLVSNNRNGLQGAGALMANDFTYFQYPYNMFGDSPLQGNFGRDLGVNLRGFFLNEKMEYRFGAFTGRNIDGGAPLRVVGRLAYNFMDQEKDFYYAGTKLGQGHTLAWGAGIDAQSTYYNFSTDLFWDQPLGDAGSITLNTAFQYMTGGTDPDNRYGFTTLIPKQTVQFAELGYYFKKSKLQPWLRFENQAIDADAVQTGDVPVNIFNKQQSNQVWGGGLNYFFNGLTTNVRLSYTTRKYQIQQLSGDFDAKWYGQFWAQLQLFIF